MSRRNLWIAGKFSVELERSGDEHPINLPGSTAAPSTASVPNRSQLRVVTFVLYSSVLATFSVLWVFLPSSWGLLC